MQTRIRRLAAVLAMAGLLTSLLSSSALGAERAYDARGEPSSVPMIFDVLVMRPIGLTATVVGTVFYVFPVAPLMAITRPVDIGKPLGPLVATPARFTFVDPIGQHP